MSRWIYVPSVGRAGNARTLDWIDPDLTVVVVRPEEIDSYKKQHPGFCISANQEQHVGATRSFISRYMANGPHIQVDDDLVIRCVQDRVDVMSMILSMKEKLDHFSLTGIGMEYMGSMHYKQSRHHTNMPAYCIYGIHPEINNAPLEHFPVCEDKVLNIWAMANRGTSVDFAGRWSNASFDKGVKGMSGGCFEYRTQEMLYEIYDRMAAIWPRYVSIRSLKKVTVAQGFEVDRRLHIGWGKIRREAPGGVAQDYLTSQFRDWLQSNQEDSKEAHLD